MTGITRARPRLAKAGLAVLLSLLVHALLAALLCGLPGVPDRTAARDLDTRVEEGPRLELVLAVEERARSALAPSPAAPPPGPIPVQLVEAPTLPQPVSTGPDPQRPVIRPASLQTTVGAPPGAGVVNAAGGSTAGTGSGGMGQGQALFPTAGAAQDVVFVIDRSLSMGLHGAWPCARRELLACLYALPAGSRFQVIAYNHQAEPLRLGPRCELLPTDRDTLQRVGALLMDLRPAGNTDHLAAVRRGLLFRPQALFLVTDAAELNLKQVADLTRENRGQTAIHVIELSHALTPSTALRLLAEWNHGTYRRVGPSL